MRRILKEPLLHFVAIGCVLFVLFGRVSREAEAPPDEIVVDQQRLDILVQDHVRTWQRSPTSAELERLIDAWVREEILYREGLAAGLERNDRVIQRRVVQKVTFLAESMAAELPDETELRAWFGEHAGDYQVEPSYSFRQVYFDSARHGATLDAVIAKAQSALNADARADVGDRTLLPRELSNSPNSELERVFGKQFVAALAALPHGTWQSVESGLGKHLVRISARNPARTPKLEEVRRAVERDFARARTQQAVEDFYRRARARYQVRIEQKPGGQGAALAIGNSVSNDDT